MAKDPLVEHFIAFVQQRGIPETFHELYRNEVMGILLQCGVPTVDRLEPSALSRCVRDAEKQLQNRKAVCVALESFVRYLHQPQPQPPPMAAPQHHSPQPPAAQPAAPPQAPPQPPPMAAPQHWQHQESSPHQAWHSEGGQQRASAPPPAPQHPQYQQPAPQTYQQPAPQAQQQPAPQAHQQPAPQAHPQPAPQAYQQAHAHPPQQPGGYPPQQAQPLPAPARQSVYPDAGDVSISAAVYPPGASEYRRFVRVPFNREVEVIGSMVTNRCSDLSLGGMYLETVQSYELGAQLELSFKLQPSDSKPLRVHAQVVYYDPGVGAGLDFVDMPRDVRARIRQFVEEVVGRQRW